MVGCQFSWPITISHQRGQRRRKWAAHALLITAFSHFSRMRQNLVITNGLSFFFPAKRPYTSRHSYKIHAHVSLRIHACNRNRNLLTSLRDSLGRFSILTESPEVSLSIINRELKTEPKYLKTEPKHLKSKKSFTIYPSTQPPPTLSLSLSWPPSAACTPSTTPHPDLALPCPPVPAGSGPLQVAMCHRPMLM